MMSVQVTDHHRDELMWKSSMSDSDSYSDDATDQHSHQLGVHSRSDHLDHVLDDDDEDMDDLDDEDDDMDKLSSSPSIDEEDIDFNFVYALHNFVATVEGQANAAKGDTMVLLDDSNSYWWLVRVVKDNTIGYLPAEHIETPTERLARLNKHRNIDLAATMLSDTMEKSANPRRKALRRRGAKTVVFTDPTYVEASDYDYTTEEEFDEMSTPIEPEQQDSSTEEVSETATVDGSAASSITSPLSSPDTKPTIHLDTNISSPLSANGSSSSQAARSATDSPITSPIDVSSPAVESATQARPTLRNTDSFFRDGEVETRKISLTPNLLRDTEPQPQEVVVNNEPEKRSPDRKDDRKEKKSGILSNLFKRRAAKPASKSLDEGIGKTSLESISSSEMVASEPVIYEKKPAKLTKNRDRFMSPTQPSEETEKKVMEVFSTPDVEPQYPDNASIQQKKPIALDVSVRPALNSRPVNQIHHLQHHLVSSMDMSDEDEEEEEDDDNATVPALIGDNSSQGEDESLASSPLGHKDSRDLDPISESQATQHLSIPSSDLGASPSTTSLESRSSRRAGSALEFSSTRLLQFIQQPSHVRDLLLVIRDVENVEPVPASHPMMEGLFVNETKDLDRIGRDLDMLLGSWFEKRAPATRTLKPSA